eukprot:TRINITY_DN23714_c0_g1_i1.p1 TRINITY_DN23714_c0_g1~~TRINITY_DN23714_c0_g1_i1.p1  ORF type:complete len:1027 (+),score=317.81 TRINITY_DN23714_c0_g1_i1:74-3154(+)
MMEEDNDLEYNTLDNNKWSRWYYLFRRRKSLVITVIIAAIVLLSCAIIIPLLVFELRNQHHSISPVQPESQQVIVKNGAVAADHEECSKIGVQILQQGGHAVDAIVATALCQGVVNPFASGIGGGGIMMVYSNNPNKTNYEEEDIVIIDSRETAPNASFDGMFQDDPKKSIVGPLSIGVPGELKGLHHSWSRFGKLPWSTLVKPAANLADNGFVVRKYLATVIREFGPAILSNPGLQSIYAPNNSLLQEGQTCVNKQLAKTLNLIAENGIEIFYNGTIGQQLSEDILAAGGILTFEDLQNYTVVERQPLEMFYMGYKLVLVPPPFGGAVVTLVLNILERYNLAKMGYNVDSLHLISEALKWGFSDRLALGDPDFVNLTEIIEQMISKDHASSLRDEISLDQTYDPSHYIDLTDEIFTFEDHGTTHMSAVDSQGNSVSFTTTINYGFGSQYVSPSTGILLNDEMDDFSATNSSNAWNIPPSKNNIVVPGKRTLSSMSPTMVFKDSELYMVAGANGGPRIITSTLQTILNVLSFENTLEEAITAPRIYTQYIPPVIFAEPELQADLVKGKTAPNASFDGMFQDDPKKSIVGPLSIGVPGELKGLHHSWSRFGKLPWSTLVKPAANLADNGFVVRKYLATVIREFGPAILSNPGLQSIYAPNNSLLQEGQTCVNKQLAKTLNLIAENGIEIFYNGTIGQQLSEDILAAGGILTFEDLQNYTVVERQPLEMFYMGYKLVLVPPPFGGAVVTLVLNILERYNLAKMGYNVDSLHLISEALKWGFSDRLALGDPDFVNLTEIIEQMISKDHASSLRDEISLDQTYDPSHYIDLTDEIFTFEDHGTTHMSAVDSQGNSVSFTTTINYGFGSQYVSPSTGILLNDEMDDFSATNSSNAWNIPPSKNNIVVPGKRTLSSMSPTMVFKDSELYMVAGANGGPRIITSTLQTILNVLSFENTLEEAITAPRIYTQYIPPVIFAEPELQADLVKGLQAKGNTVQAKPYASAVQGIMIPGDGTIQAVSDWRKGGIPAGY